MRVAIYDKGGGGFTTNARNAAIAVFGVECVPAFAPSIPSAVNELCAFSHIVCHLESDQTDPSWPKLLAGELTEVKVIIRVSSQGAGGMSDSYAEPFRVNNDGTWILHLIDRSAPLTEEKWKELWLGIQQWNMQSEPTGALALFFTADHVEELWTLHALCEAAQLAELNPGGPIQKPTDWLEPFDQRPRPGGLFDAKGVLPHQTFMRARQSANPSEPTVADITECLAAVRSELVALKQIP